MNNDKTNEYLPDLPCLESVKSGEFRDALALGCFSGLVIYMLILTSWAYCKYSLFLPAVGRALFFMLMALEAYIVLRIATSVFTLQTNSDALTLQGVFRKRVIFWNDIQSASYRKTRLGCYCLFIETGNRTIKVYPSGIGGSTTSGQVIVASVWQHLRRLNRTDSIELPSAVKSLWEDVPNDVPQEITWGKSPNLTTKIGAVIAAIIFPAMAGSAILLCGSAGSILLWLIIASIYLIMGFFLISPEILHKAHKVSVKRDGIEIELALKRLHIPWSEITSSTWLNNSSNGKLNIKSVNPRAEVDISYLPGNKESENLLLAIIRQLRSSSAQIAIPLPSIMTTSDGQLKSCSQESSASLRRAYLATLPKAVSKKLQWLYVLPSFACIAGMAGLFGMLFLEPVGSLSKTVYSGADILYFFPGLCLPLFLSGFACALLLGFAGDRLALYLAGKHRSEFTEYISIGSSKKFDHVFVRVLAVITILGIAATPLYVGYYMKITNKGIVVNRLLELHERHYGWNRISSVEVRRKAVAGESCSAGTYYINFSDGSYWKLDKGDYARISNKQIRAAVDYVTRKAHKPIKTVWKE